MSFSSTPEEPTAPGSTPPWPGSIATTGITRCTGVVRSGGSGARLGLPNGGVGRIAAMNPARSVGARSITRRQGLAPSGLSVKERVTFAELRKSRTKRLVPGRKRP